ncbi:MAG: glycoside hydrolase family 97 protein [Bacteroidales bacterium]|nr:glycoside hydrolase family 97 protein [Bacteroidales bacterium]
MKSYLALFTAFIVGLLTACQSTQSDLVSSPDGRITVAYTSNDNGSVDLKIIYSGETGDSSVFEVNDIALLTSDSTILSLKKVSGINYMSEDYNMLSGKRLHCTNEANELVFTLTDRSGVDQNVIVRVYNDGLAFRYELPDGGDVCGESATFNMNGSNTRWLQSFEQSYEGFFKPYTDGINSLMDKTSPFDTNVDSLGVHFGFPSLFEFKNGSFALLTEADVHHHNSAASLWNDGQLLYRVAAQENVGKVEAGWKSPWRVAIVGSLSDVVESTLVTDVCEPSRLTDTDWVKPGVASWIYWAYNHGSNDFQIVKQYVDMAYELHLPYVLIDAEWDEMSNGGNVDDAINYATEKGVKTLLWYNSTTAWLKEWGAPGPFYRLNKPEDREKEFSWLEEKGVAGIKVDFFETDKESTMNYCVDILESAAKHHLVVNFHGATLPRGWQRTYPNLVSTEAVYGAEWYNNGPVLTPRAAAHNATLPFTRGVVGSMDYTPCTFTDSQNPHITTDAHELALTVLFESAVMHLADRPSAYLSQPEEVKGFLTNLPTVWDETHLVSGYPAKSVVMARRNGETWYVAGINGLDEIQDVDTDLSALNVLGNNVTLYQDGESSWDITNIETLPATMTLKPRGGFIAVIK